MFFNAMVDITLISAALAVVSQVLQAKFAPREEMKAQQESMKKKQELMKELMKRNDGAAQKEIEKAQEEMLKEMNAMMSKSTKVMMYSLVVFLPAFWLLGAFYDKAIIGLPIPLPWFGDNWSIKVYTETNWFGWYFISYLVITLALGQLLNLGKKISFGKGVANA